MPAPHVIRLRWPWDCELLAQEFPEPDSPPTIRCARRFNSPTNLAADERVWLVCDAIESRASFTLNGRHLGTIEGHRAQPRFDITEALAPANLLVIEVTTPDASPAEALARVKTLGLPGGIGEVRLEIAAQAPDWRVEELDER